MSEETPEEPEELVVLEMGLRAFQHEIICPKCGGLHMSIAYHPTLMISMESGTWPCAAWVADGMLTSSVTEHLCLRCSRCGYGYPSQTADA